MFVEKLQLLSYSNTFWQQRTGRDIQIPSTPSQPCSLRFILIQRCNVNLPSQVLLQTAVHSNRLPSNQFCGHPSPVQRIPNALSPGINRAEDGDDTHSHLQIWAKMYIVWLPTTLHECTVRYWDAGKILLFMDGYKKGKDKVIPLQARCGPEGG